MSGDYYCLFGETHLKLVDVCMMEFSLFLSIFVNV